MTYEELRTAVQEMKRTREVINSQANTIADLLEECIEQVGPFRLKHLKKKLRRFDAHRGCWND